MARARKRSVPELLRARPDESPVVTDEVLAAAAATGDERALVALYDRYGPACYGLARRITADDALAQDVVQEVFLSYWRDPARYDPARGSFSTWLLTVAHHRAVDAVRREQQHRGRTVTLDRAAEVSADLDTAELATQSVRAAAALRALRNLPDPQREALALAYFGGYTQREIAGMLAIPLGTVKTRTMAGLARLRDVLAPAVITIDRGDR